MKFIETPFQGLWILEPKVFRDSRGFFMESYNKQEFARHGITEDFVQDNISRSGRGTLRGLHYQLAPHGQGKLVCVTSGSAYDVSVDIRKGSPTFGKWFAYTLTEDNRHALYIPPGFAHGFCVLSDDVEFFYKCTAPYAPQAERSIAWNDEQLNIPWPIKPDPELMSAKDRCAPPLENAEINFHFKSKEMVH